MKLSKIPQEELELLSYTDLTDLILKEQKKAMTTPQIFHMICDLLGLSEEQYAAKVGDYYTSLTTDKRFILLESAEWDLKERHSVSYILEDDEELEEDDAITLEDEEEELDDSDGDDVDDLDDDLEDLEIIEDEEEELDDED